MINRRHVAIPAMATHRLSLWCRLKDPTCRYSMWKSGNVAEKTQSSFMYDKYDVEPAGMVQKFVTGDKIVPANVQDAPLAPHMEEVQCSPVGLCEGPGFRTIQ